ncbi:nitrate reductase [Selenomonas noxia]|uniref:nitrate reductase n=1 Tax=Selenomonas noxia TaxID=135083 RepID=UPI0028D354E0|nr:nitrate reductase [Selenomonas noxia]
MNSEKRVLYAPLCDAFILVFVAALALVLTASLLARTGMPFTAAYPCGIVACVIGTLMASRGGRTLIAFPSPSITAWLVYEEIIARGIAWQELLGIAAVVSLSGALLTRTKYAAALQTSLPPIIRTGLIFGLGLTMLITAALYARILLPSPWALTMGGTLSDPLTYYTLIGVLLVLLLHAMRVRFALPLGMGIVTALTWAEGFWEIPAAPFLQPDILTTAFVLTAPGAGDFLSAAALGLTLLFTLAVESTVVLSARTDAEDLRTEQGTLSRLFAVSGFGALIGSLPLSIAPISAVLPAREGAPYLCGIPLTAWIFSLFLFLLLPCAPLLQAVSEFPAAPAVALAVLGLMLLLRALAVLSSLHEPLTLRESAVIAAFLLAAYDIKTGLTAALLTWMLLTAICGERCRIARGTWELAMLLTVLALLKWTT